MKIILMLVLSFIFITAFSLLGANQTIIGTIDASGVVSFSVDKTILEQAFEDELNDGSTINDVQIKQDDNGDWFLVGYGQNGNKNISVNIMLFLNISNNFFISLDPNNTEIHGCQTTSCSLCNWKYCLCTDNQPGHACYSFENVIDNGIGYLGNFY